jgi:outer membrane receptor protein involved in Fe transport
MKTLAGIIATATLGYAQVSPGTGNELDDEDVLELSPFTVEEAQDGGYAATSTLAGSRIRSDVRDLGSSLSIITKDFLDDTGATDGQSLLSMVGSIEVGGTQGNFAGTTGNSTNATRINPQNGQRVRGLVSATTTRDYFTTNIPFDSYNTSRVEVNRGPNSILFGLGSPGGVINNSTNVARIGNDGGQIQFRIGHRGSHRTTLDLNETLIDDRLAIRLDVLNERTEYKQNPAFEKDTRYYGAFDLTLRKDSGGSWFGKTSLKGSHESGRTIRNPPDVIPPTDGFSSWWNGVGGQDALNRILSVPGTDINNVSAAGVTKEQVLNAINAGLIQVPDGTTADAFADAQGNFVPQTLHDRIVRAARTNETATAIPFFLFPAINYNSVAAGTQPGWNDPDLAGIQGIMGRWRPNGFPTKDFITSANAGGGPGYSARALQDRQIFDYHNNLFQGTTNNIDTQFDVSQLFLEQQLFDGKMGVELAWNNQSRSRTAFTAFSSGGSKTIAIDITSHQAPADDNFDGIPDRLANENLGRPIVVWDDNTVTESWDDQETLRATVYGTLDTRDYSDGLLGKILGKHTVTGLYEDRQNDSRNRQTRGAWWADNGPYPGIGAISNGDNNNFRRIVKSQVYLGDSVLNASSPQALRIDGPIEVDFPKIGDTYGIWYFNNTGSIDAGEKNDWRIIENLQSANVSRRVLESKAISIQSHLFWDSIVAMYAWREDEQNTWRRLQRDAPTGPTGSLAERIDDPGINEQDGNFNEALLFLEDTPFATDKDQTTTWSVVGKYPEKWLGDLPFGANLTAHYYEAESFEPAGGQVNVYNTPLASPLGTTKEWGATVELFEGRLSIKYNNYETVNANARTNLGGQLGQVVGRQNFFLTRIVDAEDSGLDLFPSAADALLTTTTTPSNRTRLTGTDADLIGVNSYAEYYARLLQILPPEVQAIYNYQIVRAGGEIRVDTTPLDGSLQATRDFVATGHEIDIAGKLTNNISLSLNIAKQKTVTSNTGPFAIPLALEIEQRIKDQGLYNIRDSPFQVESGAIGASRYEAVLRTLRAQKALDNTQSPEQREWRVNAVARYDFTEGRFKGLAVGGVIRYQSEIAAGYPNIVDEFGAAIPDVANPNFGPDELNGDMFLRYRRKLSDKLTWSVQLNARNLYRSNGSNDIPVTINPDGTIASIRIPNEKQFFLTNTFSF